MPKKSSSSLRRHERRAAADGSPRRRTRPELRLEPGQTAILAIRHPSGALTFHLPGSIHEPGRARAVRRCGSRSRCGRPPRAALIGQAIKAIVIKVAQVAADKAVSLLLPRLAEAVRKARLEEARSQGRMAEALEGDAWPRGALESAKPVSPERSLLFIHGTFSNAAVRVSRPGRFQISSIASRTRYADRIFAFDHFSVSRTPEQNARMLLEALPEQTTTFDVVTHSPRRSRPAEPRGAAQAVRRSLAPLQARSRGAGGVAERRHAARDAETLGRDDRLDGQPARAVSGQPVHDRRGVRRQRPGLAGQSCVGRSSRSALDGRRRRRDRGDSGSAGSARRRLLGVGRQLPADRRRCCSACWTSASISSSRPPTIWSCRPRAGGASIARAPTFIPAARIGCFGPGGNLPGDSVTHVNFFSHAETADFLVNALLGRQQPLNGVDPRKSLPDRRLRAWRQIDGRARPANGRAPARESGCQPDDAPRRRAAADHRHQRRPDVRARGAAARPLSGDATDRHRKGHGQVDRRGDEALARHGRVSGRDRLASDLHQHPPESRARLLHASPESRHHRRPRRGRKAARPRTSRSPCVRRSSPGRSDWPRRKQHAPADLRAGQRRCLEAEARASRQAKPHASSPRACTKRTRC